MAGLRFRLDERLELGLRHRYFDAGIVKLVDAPRGFAGNVDTVMVGTTPVNRITNANVTQDFEGHWRTRSVQLSLGYRF